MKFSFVPAGTPHLFASEQTEVPPGFTDQPCAVRIDFALLGLYAYGLPSFSSWAAKLFVGHTGTGPYVPTP